jgi:hypothetical protein
VGIVVDISLDEFAAVYRGEGRNAPQTPLEEIFPRATRLALFAVTLGEPICSRIAALFAGRDFALASMLDAAASVATERAGDVLERLFQDRLLADPATAGQHLLRYSPGYCGWHLSGQKALFELLKPREIGVSLRESYLMEPLKSMTGVIVSGEGRIHLFRPDYPFCEACVTHSCRPRMRAIAGAGHTGRGD